ncbi:MAG: HAMP domain-containing sensor histidine kinase [Actinomycetota bacterium]
MRRRIVEAIVGVAALLLLALGIPLAIAVDRSVLASEVVELQATAARTLAEIALPIDPQQLQRTHAETDSPPPFDVYDAGGNLVFGQGPSTADDATRRALDGETVSTTNGRIVVITPIIDHTTERIAGALRLTESLSGANRRVRFALLIMAASGLVALGLGWLVANRLARRLTQPLADLAAAAATTGDGGPVVTTSVTGVAEIDTLTEALDANARRVSDALARERRFSADVSHQLRTPLTAIRLRVDAARANDDTSQLVGVLEDLGRIESTVDHLLAFARDDMQPRASVRLDELATTAASRWRDRFLAAKRPLSLRVGPGLSATGTAASVSQVLDVLLENAIRHGRGAVTVATRRIPGGAAVDVADEGDALDPTSSERIFRRGEGTGTGIGLALARSLVEADGGRLVLSHQNPTTFSLILLDRDDDTPVAQL